MESTCNAPSLVDVPARLSPAQKRDLLGQAVAAVLTTALIAAPLITPPPGGVAVSSETTLPAQSFAGAVTSVALEDVDSSPIRAISRPARQVARARVRTESRLLASAMPARMPAIATAGDATTVETAPAPAARKPLSRKLTGWLTGDGTLTVRPFPVVGAGRP